MKTLILVALLFALGIVAVEVQAQEGGPTPSPDVVNAIAKNIYCPICANVPLDACGTAACAQWRQQIGDLLAEGYTEQQIYDYFVEQYGESVLAAPRPRGLNILIYALPVAAILAGAAIVWANLRPSRRLEIEKAEGKASPRYVLQIEKELKKRSKG
ncbi:MAG: cytochrome c-type biogenesis protein [Anaerolineales bacterium]